MIKVAVVILNFNGRNFLQQFLPSVLAFSEGAKLYWPIMALPMDHLILLKESFRKYK